MASTSDAPADVLAAARKQLEVLKTLGLTPEAVMELWHEDDPNAAIVPGGKPRYSPAGRSVAGPASVLAVEEVMGVSEVNGPVLTRDIHVGVRASWHQPRSSVSSTASASSGKASIFSQASANTQFSFESAATCGTTQRDTLFALPTPTTPTITAPNVVGQKMEAPSQPKAQQQPQPPPPPPPQRAESSPDAAAVVPRISSNASATATAGGSVCVPTNSQGALEKRFWCTSCDAGFRRKFDWKRHEEEFHERWKKYPCPDCNRAFWGANTFNQHHKSAHNCKTCPHAEKVVKYLRRKKAWGCGFCGGFVTARDRYFEHVSKHFELGNTKADWLHSLVIYGLLHQPVIHEAWKRLVAQRHGGDPGRQPNFSWAPATTGRAQGFMENECPGQLQDLLEFFSGSAKDAELLVQYAYDQADVMFRPRGSSPTSPPQQQSQRIHAPDQQAAASSSQWEVYGNGGISPSRADGRVNNQARFSIIHVGPRAPLQSRFSINAQPQQVFPQIAQHQPSGGQVVVSPHLSLPPHAAGAAANLPAEHHQTHPHHQSMMAPLPQHHHASMQEDFQYQLHQHHPHLPTNTIDKELPLPPRPKLEVLPEEDFMSFDVSPTAPQQPSAVSVSQQQHQRQASGQLERPQLPEPPQREPPTVPGASAEAMVEDWESFATTMVDDGVVVVPQSQQQQSAAAAMTGMEIDVSAMAAPGTAMHHSNAHHPSPHSEWELVPQFHYHPHDAQMTDGSVHHQQQQQQQMQIPHHMVSGDVAMTEAHMAA